MLQKPLPRALYLLDLVGFPLEEGGGGVQVAPEFLMEVMELNEELAEAGAPEVKIIAEVVKNKLEENDKFQKTVEDGIQELKSKGEER